MCFRYRGPIPIRKIEKSDRYRADRQFWRCPENSLPRRKTAVLSHCGIQAENTHRCICMPIYGFNLHSSSLGWLCPSHHPSRQAPADLRLLRRLTVARSPDLCFSPSIPRFGPIVGTCAGEMGRWLLYHWKAGFRPPTTPGDLLLHGLFLHGQ